MQGISVPKNGYLYVYCSNESNINVFFDNLEVVHTRGQILEETHYYPFGLTMAGISSKSAGSLINKKKFNGIELNTDFDINIGETFFRSHDPQIGRWLQIDPKPNEMFSPYSAMNNNPLLLSDPMGDTTWIYDATGTLSITITDNKKNQIHFGSFTKDKNVEAQTISGKGANKEATWWRKNSTAFIGSKTMSDLKSIASKSASIAKEIAFVGTIGKDREIRLQAMPVDKNNHYHSVTVDDQADKNYSKEQQANLFLYGHIHHNADQDGRIVTGGSNSQNQKYYGEPSNPADYNPALYRSANADTRGQSPALIGTNYGVTVYGTGTSVQYTQYGPLIDNIVIPGASSYYLYKNLK